MSTKHILINKTNITNTCWLVSALLFIITFVFSTLLFSPITIAKEQPSFDCNKATTEVEKIICSDDELARLDEDNNCKIYTILNCKKINNQIEDLTCSDSELIKLYNEMQEKYFKLCKSLPNKNEQIKLYKDQTKWLNEQEMADYMSFGAYSRRIFYLKKAYQEKLNDLENYNK